MKTDKIFTKVIATIAVLLVALLLVYFATVKTALDESWRHTYFPGSIFLFCVFILVLFSIKKKKTKKCHDCGVKEGKFHKPGCDWEECPFCHNQLIGSDCNCRYEKLRLDPTQEPVYSQGLNSEQGKEWDKILKEKGRIPYGQETRL